MNIISMKYINQIVLLVYYIHYSLSIKYFNKCWNSSMNVQAEDRSSRVNKGWCSLFPGPVFVFESYLLGILAVLHAEGIVIPKELSWDYSVNRWEVKCSANQSASWWYQEFLLLWVTLLGSAEMVGKRTSHDFFIGCGLLDTAYAFTNLRADY